MFSEIPMILYIVTGAIILDLIIGDPPWLPHPVVGMGKWISFVEKKWNHGNHRRIKGVLLASITVGFVYLLSLTVLTVFYRIHPVAGIALEIYLIFTTLAIKGLKDAALEVARPLVKGELLKARQAVSRIVGRDTEHMDEKEVVRATVETVAENTVDGITSPLFWAMIGGAPAAMAYRACNTLDSMVGYKNDRFLLFGWASARLDDWMNWLPARLTALCMWIFSFFIPGSNRRGVWTITLRDAPRHPSPNSGWPEAMAAGLLGVQLGGLNMYSKQVSNRAKMGDPLKELSRQDIFQTITYMHGAWIAFYFMGFALYSYWN